MTPKLERSTQLQSPLEKAQEAFYRACENAQGIRSENPIVPLAEIPDASIFPPAQAMLNGYLQEGFSLVANKQNPERLIEIGKWLSAGRLEYLRKSNQLSAQRLFPAKPNPLLHPDRYLNLGNYLVAVGYDQQNDPWYCLSHALSLSDPEYIELISPIVEEYIQEAERLIKSSPDSTRLFNIGMGWEKHETDTHRLYAAIGHRARGETYLSIRQVSKIPNFSQVPRCKELLEGYILKAEELVQGNEGGKKVDLMELQEIGRALSTATHPALAYLGCYYKIRGECPDIDTTRLPPKPSLKELQNFPHAQKATYFLAIKGYLGKTKRLSTVVSDLLMSTSRILRAKPQGIPEKTLVIN